MFLNLKKQASSDITTLLGDYVTTDNVHLVKGQHIQILQRLNNEFCLVQLLSDSKLNGENVNVMNGQQKQVVEVQVPISLIKYRNKHLNIDGRFIFYKFSFQY